MINIFEFSWETLLAWTTAFTLLEPASYYAIPALTTSKTVQEYYDISKTPAAVVVFGDYIYSTFLLLISMMVGPAVWGSSSSLTITQWFQRFLTFVFVQWIGDLSFYQIITRLPYKSKYIDFFQRYGKEVSLGAPIGDSLYGLAWFGITQGVATAMPVVLQSTLISLFVFATLVLSY